jgi:ankyrin repeat protein
MRSWRRFTLQSMLALGAAVILGHGAALAASDVADAVMQRNAAELKRLIAARADVDQPQPDDTTALHWAAHHGDTAAASALLRAKAKPDVRTGTGVTPLAMAAESGNEEMVRLLLKARADPNLTLINGETPLMMAARNGNVAVIEQLLARGAQVDATEKLRGTTALMWAAANGNTDAVRFLLMKGADIDARSATTTPGRKPYLADASRSRLQEFIEQRGQGGQVVEQANLDAEARAAAKRRVEKEVAATKAAVSRFPPAPPEPDDDKKWGGLTPLIFATREGSLDTVKALLDAGADINQTSEYGWTALLVATQNRFYRLGTFLLERGADPNIANTGGWNPLYIATDNRNIESGDYPTRKPDMDHLEYIQKLLAAGANPNLRMQSSTETRTIFTHQWLFEEGATPFLRAAQSGDLVLMKLLLEKGADPSIATVHGITPLMVASGIGWVEGVTYEWSPQATLDTVKLLLQLGANVNAQDTLDGRTALMGAAHKGRNDVVQLLVDHGADLGARDIGSRDTIHALAGVTWQAIDYADGLVRVGVQSAIAHPETAALLRKLMKARGLETPPEGRTLASVCITELCK